MALHFTPYVVMLLVTAGFSLLVAFLASRRSAPGSNALAWLMVSLAVWGFGAGMDAASTSLDMHILWSKIQYLGVTTSPIFLLVFALRLTRRDRLITPRNLLLLSIIPFAVLVLAWTNEWHNLVWPSFTPSPNPGETLIIYGHGPAVWVLVVYSYLLLLASTLLLLQAAYCWRHIYRRQAILLLATVFFPWMGSIIYIFRLGPDPAMDFTSAGFALAGILFTYTIYRLRLFDLSPIAREQVIENMQDGYLIIDELNRIVDLNPSILGLLQGISPLQTADVRASIIGRPASEVFAGWGELLSLITAIASGSSEVSLVSGEETRSFDLHISPISTRGAQRSGRLIILHEITELKASREQAEQGRRVAEALLATGMALNSTLESKEILSLILEQLSRVMTFRYGVFQLLEGDELVIAAVRGLENPDAILGQRFSLKDNAPSRTVVETHQPVLLTDLGEEKTLFLQAYATDIRSFLAIPIIAKDKLRGVLALYSKRVMGFTPQDERIASIFANQVAIALENSAIYEQMKEMAITDALTGLYNRRYIFQMASYEFLRARRYRNALSVIMMDLDNFKEINDTYGHNVGDRAMQAVGRICAETMRKVDIVGRYGGDEFTILLPETPARKSRLAAERIRRAIMEMRIMPEGIRITASLGIATDDARVATVEDLLIRADKALYAAKQGGRNRACVYSRAMEDALAHPRLDFPDGL